MTPRACAAMVEFRVARCCVLLLQGHSRAEIVAHAADRWGIGSRSVDRLLAAARREIRNDMAATLAGLLDALAVV